MRQYAVLADLRAKFARIEGVAAHHEVIPFELDAIDSRLPGGGLATGALHEVAGSWQNCAGASHFLRPGAGIGWHRDRPVFEHFIGISLGAEAVLRFRRRNQKMFERASMPIAPRSIYHLDGEARADWEHSIAPIEQPRWSITLRTLRDRYGR